ncbi:hypothetical protein DUI87_06976 [Hirundo rustica rustica]|uniref:Uncharacterized protein n=1 Tax=Hirundo rustica rustica TaxID=333673 RepID=A0A3M0KVJ9_HIRRU|nr:hypothetical protein DUI87_06976 [Hirundo rustica rustica]
MTRKKFETFDKAVVKRNNPKPKNVQSFPWGKGIRRTVIRISDEVENLVITAVSISSTLINQTQQWLQERHYLMREALRMYFEHISPVNMVSNAWLVYATGLSQRKKKKLVFSIVASQGRLPSCCGIAAELQKELWSDDIPCAIIVSKSLFVSWGRKQQLSMNELFACESKALTGVIYLDLCKAFDPALHNHLISKLDTCGHDRLTSW